MAHDEERNRIAENGYRKFLKGWTYGIRAETILDVCLPGWRPSCPNVQAYAPEYGPNGWLVPSSANGCLSLSRSDDGQSPKKEEVVLNV